MRHDARDLGPAERAGLAGVLGEHGHRAGDGSGIEVLPRADAPGLSVAFPAISTGVYAYPLEEATRVAVETVRAELAAHASPEKVVFCVFSPRAREVYERVLGGSRRVGRTSG